MKIKIACWNVNGLRACITKGFFDWVAELKPDIICLQEIKVQEDQLVCDLTALKDYTCVYASAARKGYSGVALFSRKKLDNMNTTIGLGIEKFDVEGRTVIAEYPDFILYNSYYPNGQPDHGRVPYKLEYSRSVVAHALKLKKLKGKPVILTGDFNTAHQEIDLARPKENRETTGFLPHERAWIDELIGQGFHDIFRERHPGEVGHYTWWSFRAGARPRNVGWRIDYFFVTSDLLDRVKKIYHQPEVMGSDHCPLVLELAL